MEKVGFRVLKVCPQTQARLGEMATPHGTGPTPAFVPVASRGTVRSISPQELREIGVDMVLGNTYHLYLQPGTEVIRGFGGLHTFMGWSGPLLTDSGGYQVFSLANMRRVNDEGVLFRSPTDGKEHFFTPELSVEVQQALGADIIMAFDHPPAYGQDREAVARATQRSHLWAERCLKAHQTENQLLWAIIQGGVSAEMRQASARHLASLDFPGYALGGLSLGEPREVMWHMVELSLAQLPTAKPHYLMGVGSPEELVEGVARGIDLFDSALPTRVARNGAFFTRSGRHQIRHQSFKDSKGPLQEGCACFACLNFSAGYIHHLFKAEELLGLRLTTIHNLSFVTRLMAQIRQAIESGEFPGFRQDFLARYQPTNQEVKLAQKEQWLKKWGLTAGDGRDDAHLISGAEGGG